MFLWCKQHAPKTDLVGTGLWEATAGTNRSKDRPGLKQEQVMTAVKDFKSKVRIISRKCIAEDDEQIFEASKAPQNRLEQMAILNRQPAIRGLLAIQERDREAIAEAIMAIKGITAEKKVKAMKKGELMLRPANLGSKTLTRSIEKWQGIAEDWTVRNRQAEKEEGHPRVLEKVYCPTCVGPYDVGSRKQYTETGFSNIRCTKCDNVSSAARWRCNCSTPWVKCVSHALRSNVRRGIWETSALVCDLRKRKAKKTANHDKPLPKTLRCEEPEPCRTRLIEDRARLNTFSPSLHPKMFAKVSKWRQRQYERDCGLGDDVRTTQSSTLENSIHNRGSNSTQPSRCGGDPGQSPKAILNCSDMQCSLAGGSCSDTASGQMSCNIYGLIRRGRHIFNVCNDPSCHDTPSDPMHHLCDTGGSCYGTTEGRESIIRNGNRCEDQKLFDVLKLSGERELDHPLLSCTISDANGSSYASYTPGGRCTDTTGGIESDVDTYKNKNFKADLKRGSDRLCSPLSSGLNCTISDRNTIILGGCCGSTAEGSKLSSNAHDISLDSSRVSEASACLSCTISDRNLTYLKSGGSWGQCHLACSYH